MEKRCRTCWTIHLKSASDGSWFHVVLRCSKWAGSNWFIIFVELVLEHPRWATSKYKNKLNHHKLFWPVFSCSDRERLIEEKFAGDNQSFALGCFEGTKWIEKTRGMFVLQTPIVRGSLRISYISLDPYARSTICISTSLTLFVLHWFLAKPSRPLHPRRTHMGETYRYIQLMKYGRRLTPSFSHRLNCNR